MTLQTNENVAPYFNDYDPTKQYYQLLFKPSVSIQARELNYLQSVLQNQIEQFGTNILASGTILSGCNFTFLDSYPYAKLQDVQVDGSTVVPASYYGFFATGQTTGVKALVIDSLNGFEASDPNLKTIYLKYLNAGFNKSTATFAPGETLLITDSNNGIQSVQVVGSGVGFSNLDFAVITSQIAVNVTSGTFSNGSYLVDPNSLANLQIINIDSTSLAGNGQLLISLAPRQVDLANSFANSTNWSFSPGVAIRDPGNTMAGTIMNVFGQGAQASVVTDGAGRVLLVPITSAGNGYIFTPGVTLRSVNNNTGYASLNLVGQNFLAQPKVATTINSMGNGYAFGVSNGYIYQKGYFLYVQDQHIIVNAYSQTPNAIGVAFLTTESTINSDQDPSLLDNALGSNNYTAPGADRLKLVPTLVLVNVADSNTASLTLPLVEWSEGLPFLQRQNTVYNTIEQEMNTRTYDEAGNFLLAPFNLNTRAPLAANADSNVFSIVMSPGTAYIAGEKVQTLRDYVVDVPRGLDSTVTNNYLLSLNYGNYIRVTQVAGLFQYSTGDTVTFYDTAVGYVSNSTLIRGETISAPSGNVIGTASIRSMVLESGIPASANAIYRLYLFNTQVANGKNFSTSKSVFYNGTFKGIADLVLTQPAGTNTSNIAVINNPNTSCLVFSTGSATIKNSNNTNYTYRTIDQTTVVGNNGILVKSLASNTNDFFPFAVGNLQTSDLSSLYVVPLANDITSFASIPGTISCNTTSPNVIGSSTTFTSNLVAGDWVYLNANSTGGQVLCQVSSIVNNTLMILTANGPFVNAAAAAYRTFPKQLAVPFGTRTGLTANVDANQEILTLNFGFSVNATAGITTAVGVNIQRISATPVNKSAIRQNYVKINLANSTAGVVGPWCLGVADVFRCTGVFVGNSTVDATGDNLVSNFTIDINHTPDYIGLAYLTRNANSQLQLANTSYLLVRFDYFTSSGTGFFNPISYVSANSAVQLAVDDTPMLNVGSSVFTWEIPEFYDNQGNWYDLLNSFDFRPIANNTVTPGSLPANAPVNPSSNLSFGNTSSTLNDKHFPLPGSTLVTTLEQYAGRIDSLFMNQSTQIILAKGNPNINRSKWLPVADKNNMIRIGDFYIPDYPTVSNNVSFNDKVIMTTYTSSVSKTFSDRLNYHSVNIVPSTATPRGYTMSDIKSIDDRVSALEYYTSLSAIESDLTSRIVPSGVDPTLNRFKYGFYVDNFSNTMNSDVYNPEYAATVDNNRAYPKRISWTVNGPPAANVVSPPCAQTPYCCQNTCTGQIDLDCVLTPTIIDFAVGPYCKGDNICATGWGFEFFDFYIDMAEIGVNPVHVFINTDINFSDNWWRVEIYRVSPGNPTVETLVWATDHMQSEFVVSGGSIQVQYGLVSNWLELTEFTGEAFASMQAPLGNRSGLDNWTYFTGNGWDTFSHDCTLGTHYHIRAFKGAGARDFRMALIYPSYAGKSTCPPSCVPIGDACPLSSTLAFLGTVKLYMQTVIVEWDSVSILQNNTDAGHNGQYTLGQLQRAFFLGTSFAATDVAIPPCPMEIGCFHCPDTDDPNVWIGADVTAIPFIDLFDAETTNPFNGCYDPISDPDRIWLNGNQGVGQIIYITALGLQPSCNHDVYINDVHCGIHPAGKDGRVWLRIRYIPGAAYLPNKVILKFGDTSYVICDLAASSFALPPEMLIVSNAGPIGLGPPVINSLLPYGNNPQAGSIVNQYYANQ